MKQLDNHTRFPRKIMIHVIENRCKGCGFCIEFCPGDALNFAEKPKETGVYTPKIKNIDKCIQCKICEFICPEFAIFLSKEARTQ